MNDDMLNPEYWRGIVAPFDVDPRAVRDEVTNDIAKEQKRYLEHVSTADNDFAHGLAKLVDESFPRKDYYIRVYVDSPFRDYIVNAESLEQALAEAELDFEAGWTECTAREIDPSEQDASVKRIRG
jgi:hypothetical protein